LADRCGIADFWKSDVSEKGEIRLQNAELRDILINNMLNEEK
jgi:hypothetical protein